jgi:hypothetical protein
VNSVGIGTVAQELRVAFGLADICEQTAYKMLQHATASGAVLRCGKLSQFDGEQSEYDGKEIMYPR